METIVWIFVAVTAFALVTQRWFWILVFGVGSIAAALSVLASIFHFQIVAAIGFIVLSIILSLFTAVVADQ